jgi:hypothetical protein
MASKSCFVFKDEKIYNYIYKMKLTRKRYEERKDGLGGMID